MGFVDDHQIPGGGGDRLGPARTLGKGKRRKDVVRCGPILRSIGSGRPGRHGKLQRELRSQFLLPLRHQRRGHEDQHPFDQSPQQVLAEQEAGLDRLAQPYFVGKKNPSAEVPQHLADRFDLVGQVLDAVEPLDTEELIETAEQAEPGVFEVEQQRLLIERRQLAWRRFGPEHDRDSSRTVPRGGTRLALGYQILRTRVLCERGHESIPQSAAVPIPPPHGPRLPEAVPPTRHHCGCHTGVRQPVHRCRRQEKRGPRLPRVDHDFAEDCERRVGDLAG